MTRQQKIESRGGMLSKHTKAKYYTCLSDTGKEKNLFYGIEERGKKLSL